MSARADYVALAKLQLGKPVLWSMKGPDYFDCSGLATWILKQVGGPDLTQVDNAQHLYLSSRVLGAGLTDKPMPGDWVFYGHGADSIEHVAILIENGAIISADGASSSIRTLSVAMANPANRVREHASMLYRRDTPFIVPHRNVMLDNIDAVSR